MPLHGIWMSVGAICTVTHTNVTHVKHLVEFCQYILKHCMLYSNEVVEFYCTLCYGSCLIKAKDSPGKKDFDFWKLRAVHEGFPGAAKTTPASQPLWHVFETLPASSGAINQWLQQEWLQGHLDQQTCTKNICLFPRNSGALQNFNVISNWKYGYDWVVKSSCTWAFEGCKKMV